MFFSTVDDGLRDEVRAGYGQTSEERLRSARHERVEFHHRALR